ncbi:MAG: DUF4167 domain-containing protein [Caulobacter sp.]|nr:DUF4167 domain-containing protein [Caulobacter sp.]
MRDFKGMKRQRGRNRGGGGGNKPQQQNANRAFDSNGPEGVKVRGAAQGVFEKYQQLARDASSAGDRVLAENYLQHAEHYFRTLRAMQPHRPVSDIVGREQFASGFDLDFEAEPEDAPEQPEAPEATETGDNTDGQRQEGRRDRFENRRDRDDRPRDDRPREDRPRDERPREDRPRDDRPRDDRPREDRPKDDRPREERPEGGRRDRWRERDERRERQERAAAEAPRDPLAVIEPQAAPLVAETPSDDSPRLRGQDGAVSELPAFLGRPAQAEAREEAPAAEAKKPRRRRAPRSFEGGEGAPAETEEA